MAGRRVSLSLVCAVAVWIALGTGIVLWLRHHDPAKATVAHHRSPTKFSHVYPAEPAGYERPAVGSDTPVVDAAHRIGHGVQLTSLDQLSQLLPPHSLSRIGRNRWLVEVPIELQNGAALSVTAPTGIEFAQGAALVVESHATLALRHVHVAARWSGGRRGTAGYIVARSGSILRLVDDSFEGLGHLGPQAYGITFDQASPRSVLSGCTIRNDYFGLYLAKMHGAAVTGNHISASTVYGIDPHTDNTNLLIAHNVVTDSGVHGIILAANTSHSTVRANTVSGAADHGIVLYQHSDDNTIVGNTIENSFDGVVVSDSSNNTLADNVVRHVHRFGFRVTGRADENVLRSDSVDHAIVGVYVYAGPSANKLINMSFRATYEYVRIRSDAPANTVTPRPARSELG